MGRSRSVEEVIAQADQLLEKARRHNERNQARDEERRQRFYDDQRQARVSGVLNAPAPDIGQALAPHEQQYRAAVERARKDPDLSDEARSRKIKELTDRQRDIRKQILTEAFGGYDALIGSLKPLAKVNDDPQDEARYARIERETLARFSTQRPTLEQYREVVERGDADEVRVWEQHALRHIDYGTPEENHTRRREFADAVNATRQARMSDEQRRASQRIADLERQRDRAAHGLALRRMLPPGIPGISDATAPAYAPPTRQELDAMEGGDG